MRSTFFLSRFELDGGEERAQAVVGEEDAGEKSTEMVPVVDDVGGAVRGGFRGYVAERYSGSADSKQARGKAALVPSGLEVKNSVRQNGTVERENGTGATRDDFGVVVEG